MYSEMKDLTENRKRMEEFSLLFQEVLKGTDDQKAKDEVQQFLGEISQAYRFFVVGAEKSGRTSFLRNCFLEGEEQLLPKEETKGILELRCGAQEIIFQVEEGYNRKFVSNSMLDGIVLIDAGNANVYKSVRGSELAKGADVIFAVFSAENIQDVYTWDFIEKNAIGKKVVCILTKADLYPAEIIEEKKQKLLGYMQDIRLDTPIFAVSEQEESMGTYEKVMIYMRRNIIGVNPAESKKQNNFYALTKAWDSLKRSVENRKVQYAEDQRIIAAIDARAKEFYEEHQSRIDALKEEVLYVIRSEIEKYQKSILRELDSKRIDKNPNTEDKKTFMDWLNHEVQGYEESMNKRVADRTNQVIRHYIADLDSVCQEINDYLEERNVCLDENDSFYGTLAKSRTTAVKQTRRVISQNHEEYQALINATEELFDKLWKDRRREDNKKILGAIGGGVLGGAVGVAAGAAKAVKAAKAAEVAAGAAEAAGAATATVAAGPVVFGIVVGAAAATILGVVGYNLANKYFDGKFIEHSEEYIKEFKAEVAAIRENMEKEILEKLDELFETEFRSLDKSLLNFRTMTNIDARNIPLLESRMQELGGIMEMLRREEKVYEYC